MSTTVDEKKPFTTANDGKTWFDRIPPRFRLAIAIAGAVILNQGLGLMWDKLGLKSPPPQVAVPSEQLKSVQGTATDTVSLTSTDLVARGVRSVNVQFPAPPAPTPPGPAPQPQVPPTPPAPTPTPPAGEKPKLTLEQTRAALGTVTVNGGLCTAQAVWPKRADGRWDIVCAAHCVQSVGQRGIFELPDNRRFSVVVTALDSNSDGCWMRTVNRVDSLPFVVLADENPAKDTEIWHSGYGWEFPRNVEKGKVTGGELRDGKLPLFIDLSQGDSGGGFFRADTNELVSTACCTTRIAAPAAAYGPSTAALHRLKKRADANPVSIGNKIPLMECEHHDDAIKAPAVPLPMVKKENK